MIMIVTLLLLPICVILGATMLRILVTEKHFLQHEGDMGQTFYMAESGIGIAYRCFLEHRISDLSAVQGYTHTKQVTDGPEVAGAPHASSKTAAGSSRAAATLP